MHDLQTLPIRRSFQLLALSLVIVLSGCAPGPSQNQVKSPSPPKPPAFPAPELPERPSERYVGSQACVECHQDISEHYSHHPMGMSLGRATQVTPLEDYQENTSFKTQPGPRSELVTSYQVLLKENTVYHREIQTTKAGEPVYELDVPVEYAVGSGQRGRSYLINHAGTLFMSPVTWYSEKERWDLSPGYEGNNLHFSRRIVDGCLSCHAGRVDRSPEFPNQYKSEPFMEESIGCERCHGPGEEHIQFHRNELKTTADPIVNPTKLSPRERDHVCFQCHLVGEHRLTRYGRDEFDFRPGNHVNDIWTTFLKGDGVQENRTTTAVSQVEQMLGSACYLKSNGQLGCVSCHDPHSRPSEEQKVDFYRLRCLTCHEESQTVCSQPRAERLLVSAEDSCIQCHMPRLAASDVPHTSQTDHRVLKSYVPEKNKPAEKRNSFYIFAEQEGLIPQRELERAQAISITRAAENGGNPVLAADAIPILSQWLEVVPDDLEAQISLGAAYWLLQEPRRAMEIWETALAANPNDEFLLRRLMVLCHETQQLEAGVEYGKRLTKVNSWDYEYYGRLAHMLGQLELYDDGIAAAQRALELDPSRAYIHQWLAEVYAIRKEDELSAYHREQHRLKTLSR